MQKPMKRYFTILSLCLAGLISGCSSMTKAAVPENIKPLSGTMARIVVTREKQIAGMTTPLYIMDAGKAIDANAVIKVRVGDWKKTTGPQLFYSPSAGFMVLPVPGTTFEESGRTLDELIARNVDAVIYIDYLRCDPGKVEALYCGNGKKVCRDDFLKQLETDDGVIINDIQVKQPIEKSDPGTGIRDIQVIGKFYVGDTLIWDRKPGILRVGALWGAAAKTEHTLELTPVNVKVEPGKTYFLHYTTNLGERWKLTKVE